MKNISRRAQFRYLKKQGCSFLLITILIFVTIGCQESPRYAGRTARQWRALLLDKDSRTKSLAIAELGRLGAAGRTFEKDLLKIASNKSERTEVRISAIDALGSIGAATGTFYPDLISMSLTHSDDDESPAIKAAANAAMNKYHKR
jgi:hypothetical protein